LAAQAGWDLRHLRGLPDEWPCPLCALQRASEFCAAQEDGPMSRPLDALFGRVLVRRALKQKISEPRPTCHYCRNRVAVTALADWNWKLVKPSKRKAYLFGFRRFIAHTMGNGWPCEGSGQRVNIARGFDR
jgi:hypothetical protein